MRSLMALSLFAALTGPALAGPFDGLFVSRPEACQWIAFEGGSAPFQHDFFVLSLADGIEANQFHCTFLDTKAVKDGSALVITAFCEYPDESFPDLISLSEFDENSITVTSLYRMQEDAARGVNGMGGSQTYTRCPDLKELPR